MTPAPAKKRRAANKARSDRAEARSERKTVAAAAKKDGGKKSGAKK